MCASIYINIYFEFAYIYAMSLQKSDYQGISKAALDTEIFYFLQHEIDEGIESEKNLEFRFQLELHDLGYPKHDSFVL